MSDTPHIDHLLVRYENACARYWQNDLNPNISDRRLRELHDAMIVARRAMLDGIHAAPQAATGTVPPESSAPAVAAPVVTDAMVDRFLSWKLPEDFHPDAGIIFKREYNEGTPYPGKHQPIGTNLLTADQAREMLEHALNAGPQPSAKQDTSPQVSHTDGDTPITDALVKVGEYDNMATRTDILIALCRRLERQAKAADPLRWCVDHAGECLADHPHILRKAKEALKT